jgi:16S rRNA G966 N2-methylase RsmD
MHDTQLNLKWIGFYNKIKDQTWPSVQTEKDFLELPTEILREVLFDHFLIDYGELKQEKKLFSFNTSDPVEVKNNLEYFKESQDLDLDLIWMAGNIKVYYNRVLDGGGMMMARTFADILSKIYPGRSFNNCLEWCAGPGFIGFEIFSRNICQNLYFNDIYLPAIDSIKTTMARNIDRCQNRVFYHHSSSVSDLPQSWKFDLVVANPPFINSEVETIASRMVNYREERHRKSVDDGWKTHENFFSNIKQYLTPDAVILMAEAVSESCPDSFRSMIESNGLYINDCYWEGPDFPNLYYLEIKQQISK